MATKSIFVALFALLLVGSHVASAATVYQTAKAAGFDTLVAAIDAAGLKGALNDKDFKGTLFAPDDAAFAALLKALGATLAELLDNKEFLKKVLLYHVVPDKVLTPSKLKSKQIVHTLLGKPLKIKKNANGITIFYGKNLASKAKVVGADVKVVKAYSDNDINADNDALLVGTDSVLVPGEPGSTGATDCTGCFTYTPVGRR